MTEPDTLLPCPFCGDQPRMWGAQVVIDGDCPESIGCANDDCAMQPATDYLPVSEAIATWNRRADLHQALDDLLGRIGWLTLMDLLADRLGKLDPGKGEAWADSLMRLIAKRNAR